MPFPPYGMWVINPAKKKQGRKTSRKSAMKTRKKSRRMFSNRNPVKRRKRRAAMNRVLFLNSPRKKSKRRRGFGMRNPVRRMSVRRSFGRSNPSGGFVETVFNKDMLVVGSGVVVGNIGTGLILNKLLLPDATGRVPLALPGVDTTKPGYMQSLPVAIYRAGIALGAGYFLKDRTPKLAQGIMIGGIAGALSDLVKRSNVLSGLQTTTPAAATTSTSTAGTGAFLPSPRGVRTYIPGVPPIESGPGTRFLNPNGNRMARPGVGAVVSRKWMNRTVQGAPNFAKPN